MVGYVPQVTQLFNGTIRDNLSISELTYSDEAMIKMLIVVGGESIFETLPNGLDTIVGESGIKLSGGQSQRIALARTLLKKPRLLILDEATSMFDIASETRYVETCKALYRSMTVLIITHRPISLTLADRTLEMIEIKESTTLREIGSTD